MSPRPLCLLLLLGAAALAGEPTPPTAAEAAVLANLNAHRVNPRMGGLAVLQSLRNGAVPGSNHRNMRPTIGGKTAAPGLIWNPQLATAARDLLGAPLTAGMPLDGKAAAAATGYAGEVLAAGGSASGEIDMAYAALFVRRIGSSTGKDPKPLYAGPPMMATRWREVGVAIRRGKPDTVLVIVLGSGPAGRLAGGIAWQDGNRNGTPDAGETRDGVTVTIGGASMITGPSGIWWLPVPDATAAEALLATTTTKSTQPVPAGKGDTVINWRMPIAADEAAADRAIAKAEQSLKAKGPDGAQADLAAVALGARVWSLSDERQTRIAALTEPVASRLQTTIDACLEALTEDKSEFKAKLAAEQKPWGSALREWARELERLYALREQLGKIPRAPKEERPALADALMNQIESALKQPGDPAFANQLALWRDMAESY